jgi:hypothetical protein
MGAERRVGPDRSEATRWEELGTRGCGEREGSRSSFVAGSFRFAFPLDEPVFQATFDGSRLIVKPRPAPS